MSTPPAQSSRFVILAAGLSATVGVLAVLYLYDPATSGFYPVCPLYRMSGLQCPGCGGLRATHQLLHGHLAAAWRLNPLVVLLLPAGLCVGLQEWTRWGAGRAWREMSARPVFGWAAAAALVAFGVLRNLR